MKTCNLPTIHNLSDVSVKSAVRDPLHSDIYRSPSVTELNLPLKNQIYPVVPRLEGIFLGIT
jgi:hypothetical protein